MSVFNKITEIANANDNEVYETIFINSNSNLDHLNANNYRPTPTVIAKNIHYKHSIQ